MPRLRDYLSRLLIEIPEEPSPREVVSLLSKIRTRRNSLARLASPLLVRLAEAKDEVARKEHVFEVARSEMLDTGRGLVGAANEAERRARVTVYLKDKREEILAAKRRVREVEANLDQIQWYRAELDRCFEEVSRQLSGVELAWKMTRGEG